MQQKNFGEMYLKLIQRNLYDGQKNLTKHINFVTHLAWYGQNHVYTPCLESPPVSRDHQI